ncbi:XRE family transcriptional regulator [Rhizosaccharibacter radicis]|uniref:XRE family transcriptional regulator n=1 Tax=Rhizosaccharibacter radicis TaxID=2782605 RepID=A0ABT1W3L5_9PROT|nr:XRE family transcriptional regulator [Acetobacteraceae bacterium KSS12]
MVGHMSAALRPDFLATVIGLDGVVEPERLSAALRVTRGELAQASGLARESVSKTARLRAPATQARLREVAEIINRILPWCGSLPQAFAWYRSQPIPAFGDQTAEELVRAGRARHVMGYLSGIALGGYA